MFVTRYGFPIIFAEQETSRSTCGYLDDVSNFDSSYFDGMVNETYPSRLRLNQIHKILSRRSVDLQLFVSSIIKRYDKGDSFI